jgi:hypothetical protein
VVQQHGQFAGHRHHRSLFGAFSSPRQFQSPAAQRARRIRSRVRGARSRPPASRGQTVPAWCAPLAPINGGDTGCRSC